MHNLQEKVHEIIVLGERAKVKWICQISKIRMSLSLSVHGEQDFCTAVERIAKKVPYGLALTDLLPSLSGALKYQSSCFVCKLACHPFRRFSNINSFVLSLLGRWESCPLSAWYSPIEGETLSYQVQGRDFSSQSVWLFSPEFISPPGSGAISTRPLNSLRTAKPVSPLCGLVPSMSALWKIIKWERFIWPKRTKTFGDSLFSLYVEYCRFPFC